MPPKPDRERERKSSLDETNKYSVIIKFYMGEGEEEKGAGWEEGG